MNLENEKNIIKISVRNLVEFILRSGSIDNRKTSIGDKDLMQAGSKLHKKIQKSMGSNYYPEVPLSFLNCFEDEEFDIQVEGRADGVIVEKEQITIDEIKGVIRNLDDIEEAYELHKAQAYCYAFFYCMEHGKNEIVIQITYCNLEKENIKRFKEKKALKWLEEWFNNIINEYKKWAKFQLEFRLKRQNSISGIQFPFEYRAGQKDLVAAVYRTIERKKKIFVQAPTGVGKTISSVFPAVMAMGQGYIDKIFYLTAKTITRTVALEAFLQLKEKGLESKIIILTSKEKICCCEEMNCNPEHCQVAQNHYDRVNEVVYSLLNSEDVFTREIIEEYAKKGQVCPYEMSLDIATWSDVIICDYNYVFDPNVYLRRFFSEGNKEEYAFLIDEAHNLVERGREMYSASLYKEDFLEVKNEVKAIYPYLAKALESCNRSLLEMKRECPEYKKYDNISSFYLKLLHLIGEFEKYFERERENQEVTNKDMILEFYLKVRNFFQMYDRVDEHYIIYSEYQKDKKFKIRLFCVDTSKNIQECLERARGSVLFSATLLPVEYYIKLLSKEKDDYTIYIKSPFDHEKRLIAIGNDVSSKYTRRNHFEFSKIADYILEMVSFKRGNYLVFFPSYSFMDEVYQIFLEKQNHNISCIVQEAYMNEKDREEFLENFHEQDKKSMVGFCVMGGIFGEGIDLKGNRLIGTIVVGTGLPQLSIEREILKNYFEDLGLNGFDYAYKFQGINKVLQAAGRVIRTTDDIGVILLLDERFGLREYITNFPVEWEDYKIGNKERINKELEAFWANYSSSSKNCDTTGEME